MHVPPNGRAFLPAIVSTVLATIAAAGCSARPLSIADQGPPDAGATGAAGAAAQPGRFDWGIPVGAQTAPSVPGWTVAAGVVAAEDGGAIIAGRFGGTIAFAPDKTLFADPAGAGFVARYRSDQRLVWVTPLAATEGTVIVADLAALGGDEVVVAGWYTGTLGLPPGGGTRALSNAGGSDLFVARLAGDGSVRGATRAGGPGDDIARAVGVRGDPAGPLAIAITGAIGTGALFAGAPSVTASATDGPLFTARLTGDGAFEWVRFAGGGVPGQGYGLAVDGADGAVVVTGYVNGPASFGPGPGGAPVTVDPAHGRAVVARWSAAGDLLWAQPMGGPKGEGDAVAIGAAGDVVVTGLYEGEARFGRGESAVTLTADAANRPGAFLTSLTAAGELRWARRLVGMGLRPWRVRAAPEGALMVAGWFGGGVLVDPEGPHPALVRAAGGNDALFGRLGGDGALGWTFGAGGLGDDEGVDISGAPDGTVWAVGNYVGPATFSAARTSVTLDSGTDGGAFLLRLGR